MVAEVVSASLENDSHREQALKRLLFIPRFLYPDKEQAVSFQELRLCLRKNILGTFSFPFSSRYPVRSLRFIANSFSFPLDVRVMNQRNKFVSCSMRRLKGTEFEHCNRYSFPAEIHSEI